LSIEPRPPLRPLQVLLDALDRETDPYRQAWRLIFAFEWAVKWATAVSVGDLLDRRTIPTSLRRTFVRAFAQPSLGQWIQVHRDTLDVHGEDRPWRAWDRVLPLEDRHQIVRLRNIYAHGAFETDATNRANVARYGPVLEELLDSPLYHRVGLTVVGPAGVHHLGGPVPPEASVPARAGSYAWVPDADACIDLWPVAAYLDEDVGARSAMYFFNALRGLAVEQQNYDLPHRLRSPALHPRLLDRVPLDDWRTALRSDLDPFAALTETLAASLVGRDRDWQQLTAAVTRPGTETILLGPPGQGKSALVAAVVRRLREDAAGQVAVLDVFLRRGDATARPDRVLRSWVRRLEDLLGAPPSRSETEDALSDRFLELRTAWPDKDGRTLAIVVDAVDESLGVLEHLPRPSRGVSLLWSSRPVDAALATIDRRGATAEAVNLGPLADTDVRAILFGGVDSLDPRLDRSYVAAVRHRSRGNPLFVQALAEELFHDQDRIGDIDRLPVQVGGLFRDAVHRVTDGGRDDERVDALHLLAVAADRLTVREIAALLGRRASRIDAVVRACHELLTRDGDGRFGLYHDELRTWLSRAHVDEIEELRDRLADAALDPIRTRGADGYLVRHGLTHVLSRADDRPELLTAMVGYLGDPERLTVRLQHQSAYELLDDVARLHARTIDDHPDADRLVDAVVTLIANGRLLPSGPAQQDTVTAALMYRSDARFADRLLEHAADAAGGVPELDRRSYRGLLGDRLRRRGSPQDLERGRQLLEELRAEADDSHEGRNLRSRATYSIAYIDYLRGDVAEAIDGMRQAVAEASAADDEIGRWIAMCVGGQFRYLDGIDGAATFRTTLADARTLFASEAHRDRGAARWVTNVAAHLFEVAYDLDDAEQAAIHLEELEESPWETGAGPGALASPRLARLALLRGDPKPVLEVLPARIATARLPDGHPGYRENLARDHLDLGRALDRAGRTEEAIKVWRQGLRCDGTGAAWVWRPRLEAALDQSGGPPG
jgi:tetratricopeptide (TPR) repeat protein